MGHEELRDMRHDHFLNATCDIGEPASRAPFWGGAQGACSNMWEHSVPNPQTQETDELPITE